MTAIPLETLVTIFGGSGFLGRHVVRALAKLGYRIRVAVRRPELAGHLQPLGRVGQIHAVQANLRYPASVEAAVRDADVVINLVGILFERGRQRFDAVQAFGAEAVALAATAFGARMIHVSAIGADEQSPSHYARSKAMGEKLVLAAIPSAVILRPSILFGPEDDFFNKFAAMARISPALPLIGGGHTRFQPVFAGDVAAAVVAAIEGRAEDGRTYELGGPQVKSFKELMEFVLATTARARLLLPIPFALARLQASILQLMPKPLLTPDQVELLRSDSVVSEAAKREGRTIEALGIDPVAMATIVPSYLGGSARPDNSDDQEKQAAGHHRSPHPDIDHDTAPCPSSPTSRTCGGSPGGRFRARSTIMWSAAPMTSSRSPPTAPSSMRSGLRQRVLIDVSKVSLRSQMLGETVTMPVAIAPTGLTGLVHGDGEMLAARAAEAAGTKFCLSTMSICSIEDVRSVVKQPFWFQLYMFRDRGFSQSVIERARAAGCTALFVTVDLPMRGQRHADIKNGLTVPPRLTLRNAFDIATKPAWLAKVLLGRRKTFGNVEAYLEGRVGIERAGSWSNQNFDRSLNWRDVEWVRSLWPGKLVLKGVLDVEDAKTAAAGRRRRHRRVQSRRPPARRRPFHHRRAAGDRERRRRPHRGAVRRRHPLRAGRAQGARTRRPRLPDRPRLSLRPRRRRRSAACARRSTSSATSSRWR